MQIVVLMGTENNINCLTLRTVNNFKYGDRRFKHNTASDETKLAVKCRSCQM